MIQSPDLPPSSFRLPPSEDPLAPFFFRGFLRLLYWIFFKPTGYDDYSLGILGEDVHDVPKSLKNPQFVNLLLEYLCVIIVVNVVIDLAIGRLSLDALSLSVAFIGALVGTFAMALSGTGGALGMALSVVFGVTISVALSVLFGRTPGMADGVAFGVTFGVAGGMALSTFGVAEGVVFGLAGCVALGVAISMIGVTGGMAFGVAGSMAGSMAFVVLGLTGGVALLAGFMRLPIYFFQFCASLTLRVSEAQNALRRSPAMWDELLVLPQPRLAAILCAVLDADLAEGLHACGQIVSNPFQRWAVQRALQRWLSAHPDQVAPAFEHLLLEPTPYHSPGLSNSEEQKRVQQADFTTRLILGELAGRSPISGASDRFARFATNWLRERHPSSLTDLALLYYQLLVDGKWDGGSLPALEPFRPHAHGEEMYQTFRTLADFLNRTSFDGLLNVDSETGWLQPIERPLRPRTLEAVSKLAEVGRFVRAYQSLTGDVDRRDALTNAGLRADAARKLAGEIKSPERILIARVAQQWFDLITAEQAVLAAPRAVRHIRNMYLVGNPVRPDSGHPFVGRRDQFEMIERLWRDATLKPPIVLHGQRRMGKTSILLHLEKNLGAQYVTVFANLQSLAAVETTDAFVYNLCDEIQRRLSKTQIEVTEPKRGDFTPEPFTGLRHFLNQVEDRLGNERWLVVMLDEFERIEDKIKEGKIQSDVLYQLRDIMLNRPRFAVVLAGLHTLDQMTRNYWSPFFSGARNVKVSYLDQDAAETLITNPWDGFELQYDREAVKWVSALTGNQPTLLQSIGSALIDQLNVRLEKSGPQYTPTVTTADVDAVLGSVMESSTYFDGAWTDLAENERGVLSALAKAQTAWNIPVSQAEINTTVRDSLPQSEIAQAWDLLEQRDMIDAANNEAKFRVELVRRWVANRAR
jgi:hypothetical protein